LFCAQSSVFVDNNVICSYFSIEIRVNLLAGQQIRGKFTSIRDMTSFKVQFDYGNNVNFLCTYDDAKFVKSNPNLARRFKEFYEGKSFALNVKNVCENNM